MPQLARSGRRALEAGIRLVMHPDQFVVLGSDSPSVVVGTSPARWRRVQHAS